MKIIFSRKGFDTAAGGTPSPILPDGRMLSLPIPDACSTIRYGEIHWHEYDLGEMVTQLTRGKISSADFAHLDPDIRYDSLVRHQDWRPVFGQSGAAQGHLHNQNVRGGDLFLFFGLFKNVNQSNGQFVWDLNSPARHIIWGWLQVDEVLKITDCLDAGFSWAHYHPHFEHTQEINNTLYIAKDMLELRANPVEGIPGAGVFEKFLEKHCLTARNAKTHCLWELPAWFYPYNSRSPLTYHSDRSRWQQMGDHAILHTVSRGQEFILDAKDYPEVLPWLHDLFREEFV